MLKFSGGKQIVNFLVEVDDKNNKKHPGLLNFVKEFFKKLKAVNPGRVESAVTREQEILDALARLLVGDEVCSAIAISGEELLVATNKDKHVDDNITYRATWKILKKYEKHDCVEWRLQFKYFIKHYKGEKFIKEYTKESSIVHCRYVRATQRCEVVKGNHNVCFEQKWDHDIKFPYSDNVKIRITSTLNEQNFFEFLFINPFPLNTDHEFLPEKSIELDPLKRRASVLLYNLSAISRSILMPPEKEKRVSDYMEENKGWVQFLHDSLSFEMVRGPYKVHIDPYHPGPDPDPGMKAMREFYEWLVENYQQYKKAQGCRTSVQSVRQWFDGIVRNIQTPAVPAPQFIKDNPDPDFFIRFKMYFEDLVAVETFVRKDAMERGRLSAIVARENFFKRSVTLRLIDDTGHDDTHAEMRLLEYHLTRGREISDYYGITMLCCALCHFTMDNLKLVGSRGGHGGLYPRWRLIDVIHQEYLPRFLGDHLYRLQQSLAEHQCYFPGQKQILQNKVSQASVALSLVPAVGFINTQPAFEKLGIDLDDLLPTVEGADLYPAESFAPEDEDEAILIQFSSLKITPQDKEGELEKHPDAPELKMGSANDEDARKKGVAARVSDRK
ncbi:MAG: nucleic acid/nucleotide deaminase domain-containing protein [Candidatus Berkiellales bacterium]